MKPSSIFFALLSLITVAVADKVCTPSFDYCSDELISKKGKSRGILMDVHEKILT